MDDDELLDAEIAGLLAGAGRPDADPTLTWLAAAARTTAPPELRSRIDAAVRRTRRGDRPGPLLAAVALALAVVFASQAVGNVVAGDWIARKIGEPNGPHAYFEGALALMAAAACAAAAAVRRSWAPVSVLSASPLAVSLGLHGVGEFGVFAAGAVLHTTEGVLGLLLLWAWWRESRRSGRDTPASPREAGA
jgi:hypothetical protein